MLRATIARILLATAIAASLPSAALGQADAGTDVSLQAIALRLDDQQERIARLHERIGNVRIGTIRGRIKALEAAVAVLTDELALAPRSIVSATSGHAQELPE